MVEIEGMPAGVSLVNAAAEAPFNLGTLPGVYSLVVSPRQIRAGFYGSLQALQGHRHTYYAGAAFQTHSSAAIWAQLEELLPAIVA